ncbi:Bowman-Birk type trypsin inhibitor [Rhynchospora pubera]|uniref:Bowman-Birk type trypsin inhibitor n=1 Tax=Rhynchospora pubera TaxID=906938 RepID=A0AAV8ATF5_9POAL|nr:Bowman-Birk type trypsin inhibitor [Rhynchospora pubera]KAJ4797838.1 Bowman-Birk type trypsin inhibitor [Rhynchospora pubera]
MGRPTNIASSSSFALFAFFMMLPLVHGHRHARAHADAATPAKFLMRPWPCCNTCGGCTNSIPPRCQCRDLVRSCHPMCHNCVKSPLSAHPPLYHCMDLIANFCKYNCASSSLLTPSILNTQ